MSLKTKREIHRQYESLQRAREGVGTVKDLARQYGVTRQRIHQIVKEVEATMENTARKGEETISEKAKGKEPRQGAAPG